MFFFLGILILAYERNVSNPSLGITILGGILSKDDKQCVLRECEFGNHGLHSGHGFPPFFIASSLDVNVIKLPSLEPSPLQSGWWNKREYPVE